MGWILIAAMAAACAAPQPTALQMQEIEAPLVALALDSPIVEAGQPVALHVELDIGPAQSVLLTLSLSYPNGVQDQVLKTAVGPEATISWTVPADAGRGPISFQLRTQDCGCGPRAAGATAQMQLEGEASGTFSMR